MYSRFLTAAAVISLTFLSPVQAQSQAAPDPGIVTAIDLPTMRNILTGYGHVVVEEQPEQNGLIVQAQNGFRYVVLLKRCHPPTACAGVLIGSIHDIPEGTTWQILNTVDSKVDLLGVYVMNDRLIFDRYIALQGGLGLGQLENEIATLMQVAPTLVANIAQMASENTG